MPRAGIDLRRAVDQLAVGTFLMTAEHESRRAGILVMSAQKCACEPLLICVAARKGHLIETLIRDSRHFGLCRLDPDDRTTLRRFEVRTSERDDPFESLGVEHLVSRAPVLRRSDAGVRLRGVPPYRHRS
jgi:flavin reductase (DIM6/NTAB) family NADH-FMN oxidoreductase RutF